MGKDGVAGKPRSSSASSLPRILSSPWEGVKALPPLTPPAMGRGNHLGLQKVSTA